jgi:hypothetical protein
MTILSPYSASITTFSRLPAILLFNIVNSGRLAAAVNITSNQSHVFSPQFRNNQFIQLRTTDPVNGQLSDRVWLMYNASTGMRNKLEGSDKLLARLTALGIDHQCIRHILRAGSRCWATTLCNLRDHSQFLPCYTHRNAWLLTSTSGIMPGPQSEQRRFVHDFKLKSD